MVARRTRRRIRGGEGSSEAPLLVKPRGVNNADDATRNEFNEVLAKLKSMVSNEKATAAATFYNDEFTKATTMPEKMSIIFDLYDVIINRIKIQYINSRAPGGLVNDKASRKLIAYADAKEASLQTLLTKARDALTANNSNNSVEKADIAYQNLRDAVFYDRSTRVDTMLGRGRHIKNTRRRRIRGSNRRI